MQVKTDERDGYTALQVTFGTKKASKITKPKLGQFEKAGVDPGPQLVELRLDDVSDYSVGQELKADLLADGDKVDVTAVSKGKGTAGTMKRHGFGGLPASHGCPPHAPRPRLDRRLRHTLPGVPGHPHVPAAWAPRRSPPSTSPSCRPTPSATSCSSGAPCPAPRAASCSSVTP